MASLEVETNDKSNFSILFTQGVLSFSVTAKSGANLLLMPTGESGEPVFTMSIGCDDNQNTSLVSGNSELSKIETKNILNENRPSFFWFKKLDRVCSLGIFGNSEPLLVYFDLKPLPDPHLQFNSATEAFWIIRSKEDSHQVSTCELPQCQPEWRDYESVIPQGAFYGGFENGCPVIIGRGFVNNNWTPGKVVNGQLSVELDGIEIFLLEFQVLCYCDGKFVSMRHENQLPQHSFIAGHQNGHPIYIARIYRNGDLVLGKYHPQSNSAYFLHRGDGFRITEEEFEIFICNEVRNCFINYDYAPYYNLDFQ